MNEVVEQYPATLLVLMPMAWIALMFAVAAIGHWSRLAAVYHARAPFAGHIWRAQSAQFGWCNYGHSLIVGAGSRGLRLAVLFPFRPGHPPLQVPWEDLSVAEVKSWFSPPIELRFRRVPGARVRISRELAEKLRNAAGASWPTSARDS